MDEGTSVPPITTEFSGEQVEDVSFSTLGTGVVPFVVSICHRVKSKCIAYEPTDDHGAGLTPTDLDSSFTSSPLEAPITIDYDLNN